MSKEKKSEFEKRTFKLVFDFTGPPDFEHPDRVYLWEEFPHAFLELSPEEGRTT